eukprot:40791_1
MILFFFIFSISKTLIYTEFSGIMLTLRCIDKLICIFNKPSSTYDIVNITKLNNFTTEVNLTDQSCIQFDPSHFLEPSNNHFGDRLDCELRDCQSLTLLYTEFNQKTHNNTTTNHHVTLLNAFHHLLLNHSHEFENIYNIIIELCNNNKSCDLKKCAAMLRNHRNKANITEDESQLNQFYANMDTVKQQLLDTIHCHYFHSFDIGYKFTTKEKENIMNCEMKTNGYKDIHISEINQILNNKRASYSNINGLERLNSSRNKFISQHTINQFQFETFSFGYRYFYWNHYKNNSSIHDDSHKNACREFKWSPQPPIANAGSTVADWYVKKKYANFKEELLKNALVPIAMQQWANLCEKAVIHMKTDKVKKMKCPRTISATYYDMHFGEQITAEHIVSMMIYCNYDLLQKRFSETFRKNKSETDEELKQRHRNYYFLGKLLRECVECFGTVRPIRKRKNNEPLMDIIVVFQGINQEFVYPSMSACIKGPFSTTTDYGVAVNFCAPQGMIVQMDIDLQQWKLEKHNEMKMKSQVHYYNFMDMSWISDFSNEKEIFFIGGLVEMPLNSIVRVQTAVNYYPFIDGLKRMTSCMKTSESCSQMDQPRTALQKQMVFRLLSHELFVGDPYHKQAVEFHGLPEYIRYLLHYHCESMRYVYFAYKKPDLSPFHFNFFHYDNGWMKLHLIMTLFPNVTNIGCGEWKPSELKQAFIYESALQYLRDNFQTTALQTIALCLGNISKENDAELLDFIGKYTENFCQYGWNIELEAYDNFYEIPLEYKIPPIRRVSVVMKIIS